MEINKTSEQSAEILLTPSDVESALMQFICTCHPEYVTGWLLNTKYNLATSIMVATKP